MKKLLILLCSAILLASCSKECSKEVVANSYEQGLENIQYKTYIFEKECNGHIYVICRTHHPYGGISILHSPNCPCMKKEIKYENY